MRVAVAREAATAASLGPSDVPEIERLGEVPSLIPETAVPGGKLAQVLIPAAAAAAQGPFVYFKHEDAGLGAKFAQRFNELWAEGAGRQ